MQSSPGISNRLDCPTGCRCALTTMVCSTTIPKYLPTNITNVNLTDIDPRDLYAGRFCKANLNQMKQLSIYFDFDELVVLKDSAFKCLSGLKYLKMKGKELSTWSDIGLESLSNVTHLDRFGWSEIEVNYVLATIGLAHLLQIRHLSFAASKCLLIFDWLSWYYLYSRTNIEILNLSNTMIFIGDDESIPENANCSEKSTVLLHDSLITVQPDIDYLVCDGIQLLDLSGTFNIINVLSKHPCINSTVTVYWGLFPARVLLLNRMIIQTIPLEVSNCVLWFDKRFTTFVKELHFSGNMLPDFQFLSSTYNVEYVDFSHNQIETLNPATFYDFLNLTRVDLSHNSLTYTSMTDLFINNFNLKVLNLSFNKLSTFPGNIFGLNSNLTSLDLLNNLLSQIAFGISHLGNLESLNLAHNKVNYLNLNSRQAVDALLKMVHVYATNKSVSIQLAGNPFSCSCQALEFLQWFVTSPIYDPSYTCHLDGDTMLMDDNAIKAADNDCKRPIRQRRTILLSSVLSVAAATAISVGLFIMYRRHKRVEAKRRLEDRLLLIQDEQTGFTFTVFLSFCSLDGEFVVPHIRKPMEGHLRRITKREKDHVCDADLHFTPGANVFGEMRRCVAESAVFVAVMSENYCSNYHCQLEISEARTTGKPTILIFKEHVAEDKMEVVIKDVYNNNARAKIVKEGDGFQVYPPWERLCKAIIGLMKLNE